MSTALHFDFISTHIFVKKIKQEATKINFNASNFITGSLSWERI